MLASFRATATCSPRTGSQAMKGAEACTLTQPKRETMPLTRLHHKRGTQDTPMVKEDPN